MPRKIRIALPAGELRGPVADLLQSSGLRVEGYAEGSRAYRLNAAGRDEIDARVFREKDIPIQVAIGNYDLGVCGLAWVQQMEARFTRQPVVPLCDLGVQRSTLFAAAAPDYCDRLEDLPSLGLVRIASEYPNIAEAFARSARLARYRIQPVWGAAEAYPPEDADCVIVAATSEGALRDAGIQPLFKLLDDSAWLIGNAAALTAKDLSSVAGPLMSGRDKSSLRNGLSLPGPLARGAPDRRPPRQDSLRMAVPDGHQQRHVVQALHDAGLDLTGYGEGPLLRRPPSPIDGLEIKVIRPQDMPALVATGEMDIAITGRDCLMEHRYAFPSSPVVEVLDLGQGQYNLSAVVSEDLPASTISEAMECWRRQDRSLIRVASEFPATADHYARSRHLWRYQVIPISGASEGFVPEDADLLIEGTETGKTLAENRLKPIDLLYRSTTCVIAGREGQQAGDRRRVFEEVMGALKRAAGAAGTV